MVNIEKETISLLEKLASLNPGIPFKYDTIRRKIVADITQIRKTMNSEDLVFPEKDKYVFNQNSHGVTEVLIDTDEGTQKLAELSVDKCNLTKEKREHYENYRDYHLGDTYVEPVIDKIRGKIFKNPNVGRKTGINYSMTKEALQNIIKNDTDNKTNDSKNFFDNFNIVPAEEREEKEETITFTPEDFKEEDYDNSDVESDVVFDNKAGIFVPVQTKKSNIKFGETLKQKATGLYDGIKQNLSYTFRKSSKVDEIPLSTDENKNEGENMNKTNKPSAFGEPFELDNKTGLENTIGSAYGYVNEINPVTLPVKESDKVYTSKKGSLRQMLSYFFARSAKVKENYSIIGPGPKKIVKRPLKIRIKDRLSRKPLSAKIKGLYNGVRQVLKYGFDRSAKVEPIAIKPHTSKPNNNPVPPVKPTKPTGNDTPKPSVQPKPVPTRTKAEEDESKLNKQYEILEKEYYLESKNVFKKLGEYERMFIEDSKAECLDINDNEYRQMLNERCVDKLAIFTYYCDLLDLKQLMAIEFTERLKEYFNSLGEYERMFIEDAIAENIMLGDNEYRQMLSERCVNKDIINGFMKQYKKSLTLFKEIEDRQKELTKFSNLFGFHRNFKELNINELRKLTRPIKSELTKEELDKYNASKLKKDELVNILDRSDSAKVKKLVKGE